MAEPWDRLTWLRGRSFSLLRTTSWTLTQVGLEVSKVSVAFRTHIQFYAHQSQTTGLKHSCTQLPSGRYCKIAFSVTSSRRKFGSQTSTVWTDEQGRGREKRKIRRKKSRRERATRKKMEMREKVGRSRDSLCFQ